MSLAIKSTTFNNSYAEHTQDVFAVIDPHNREGICQVRWSEGDDYQTALSSAHDPSGTATMVMVKAADERLKEFGFDFLKQKEVKLGDLVEPKMFYWDDINDADTWKSGIVTRIRFSYLVPITDQRLNSRSTSK